MWINEIEQKLWKELLAENRSENKGILSINVFCFTSYSQLICKIWLFEACCFDLVLTLSHQNLSVFTHQTQTDFIPDKCFFFFFLLRLLLRSMCEINLEAELFTLQDSNAKLVAALQEANSSVELWKKQLAEYQEETDRLRDQVTSSEQHNSSHTESDWMPKLLTFKTNWVDASIESFNQKALRKSKISFIIIPIKLRISLLSGNVCLFRHTWHGQRCHSCCSQRLSGALLFFGLNKEGVIVL